MNSISQALFILGSQLNAMDEDVILTSQSPNLSLLCKSSQNCPSEKSFPMLFPDIWSFILHIYVLEWNSHICLIYSIFKVPSRTLTHNIQLSISPNSNLHHLHSERLLALFDFLLFILRKLTLGRQLKRLYGLLCSFPLSQVSGATVLCCTYMHTYILTHSKYILCNFLLTATYSEESLGPVTPSWPYEEVFYICDLVA